MTTSTRSATTARPTALTDPAYQAFLLLRTAFTLAPVVFGLDKFFDVLTDWKQYLAPTFNDIIPGTAHQAMLMVGVVEIVAGLKSGDQVSLEDPTKKRVEKDDEDN